MFPDNREELYLLLLLSLIGAMVLVSSRHFASLFIGLEMLSIPLYGLVAYQRKSSRSLEAGIKYLVLSATGSDQSFDLVLKDGIRFATL